MNQGKFRASVKHSIHLMNEAEIKVNQNIEPIYPSVMAGVLRDLPYEEMWRKCVESNWYDIMLEDNSIIQFNNGCYRYLMVPFKALSLDEFFESHYPDVEYKEDVDLYREVQVEYEQYVMSMQVNKAPVPVRFDVDSRGYCEHTHPYYHLHLGLDNESRVPVKEYMTPFSFSAFILRTFYPSSWMKYAISAQGIDNVHKVKDGLVPPPEGKWKESENYLFCLS
ncbi:DUF2290 domain-containing protein [Yersinia enterocolitica]|uniref:DUF2290 domain-containing protein n=1 Tax=Yersinia mollaretii TaxID=33060 RepID=UPI0005E2D9AC|nr:DUF2290 domain-containing protein [Yersinia mollaretii]ELW7370180.1 DUF2290 domain-containing protein [Yersinia enterocolitica]ELY5238398.1 DUF2290 domain-containing protein [Yersinia enterocolitica]CQD40324.1 Uncharacterized conserved protein (DUF2290) [Yersinia mollaretii]HDL7594615.1 DUF2290 domain-containing protein [Yersinia enterocolitica]HDL7658182.1 DUF2290 domain-containing protein [Yersinia enterocolitica]